MDRVSYNRCMSPYMKGSKPKEQRQLDFCIGSKVCSQKAKNEEEARQICLLPKEPKPVKIKRRDGDCGREVSELAHCVVGKIDMNLAGKSMENAIIGAMMECRCNG